MDALSCDATDVCLSRAHVKLSVYMGNGLFGVWKYYDCYDIVFAALACEFERCQVISRVTLVID